MTLAKTIIEQMTYWKLDLTMKLLETENMSETDN